MNESLDIDNIAIDICICTFRRPHVAETMRSVSKLALRPGWKVNIIVADNDVVPSAVRSAHWSKRWMIFERLFFDRPSGHLSKANVP